MARRRVPNPKTRMFNTRTTEDLYQRLMSVLERKGLKGDDWIVLFLGTFENDQDNIRSELALKRMRLRGIKREMMNLENEKISCENIVEELSLKAGSDDVEKAVNNVLQRFNNQSIYTLEEFLNDNKPLLETQSFLAGVSEEELSRRIFEKA